MERCEQLEGRTVARCTISIARYTENVIRVESQEDIAAGRPGECNVTFGAQTTPHEGETTRLSYAGATLAYTS
jgi:predicted P-loop ATPase/GTPase